MSVSKLLLLLTALPNLYIVFLAVSLMYSMARPQQPYNKKEYLLVLLPLAGTSALLVGRVGESDWCPGYYDLAIASYEKS